MKKNIIYLFIVCFSTSIIAQKTVQLKSPDNLLEIDVRIGEQTTYSVKHKGETILFPSAIAMRLIDGKDFGVNSKLTKIIRNTVNQKMASPFYKRSEITDNYNEVTLVFKEEFNLVFRAYNEGIAYRFVSTGKNDFIIENEEANFEFYTTDRAYIPYVRPSWLEKHDQFENSFENIYTHQQITEWETDRLAFSPLLVARSDGKKICIAEGDLENYPGMFLHNPDKSTTLKGIFAPYPKHSERGGYNQMQWVIKEREAYIAKCNAKTNFPWRIIIVSSSDKELADNDMVYKLASPSRIDDVSWIKPGKVAWEWWNDWNLFNVNFKTGINNETYKHYIDFASKNGIEYIIMDEGWSVKGADLFTVIPEINLKELVDYGKERNVGIMLWAGYYLFDVNMEAVCKHYSELGIKGFKIDFMDRDDQLSVDFHYRSAAMAAKYKLLVNFHGTYKPTGLQRTYPNAINFEGVYGLEQLKFDSRNLDQVTYDVTIPFIRQIAGPMDYTQGAMLNANKQNFRPINSEPMSQGTRCRQLAEYIVFESPLGMLCDSPSNYENEVECLKFITSIPTVWNNTISLDGKVGEYIVIARQKGNEWYVAGLTNWDSRQIELDLSFLGSDNFKVELFKDGINADKSARDYKRELLTIPSNKKMIVPVASGGGFVMKVAPSL